MTDPASFLADAERLAGRLRTMPLSRLRGRVAGHALTLARELAALAQRAEFPGEPVREMPDAGAHAVGDQVAVAAHDLAAALAAGQADETVRGEARRLVAQAKTRCGL
jgi:hypothetical protein